MIISGWCIVAIIALITGTIATMETKNKDCFASSVALTILIGFGYFLLNL